MTIEEASRQYHIPMKILREYESWGLCGAVKKVMGAWQYDDTDIERLSTILTLHDIGFTSREVETYMRLLLEQEGDHRARLRMLDQKRQATLDDIHFPEKQLAGLSQPWALQHSPSTQVPPKGFPPVEAQPGQLSTAGHWAQSKPQ